MGTREAELLGEQDAIEFELGAGKLECGMDESGRDDAYRSPQMLMPRQLVTELGREPGASDRKAGVGDQGGDDDNDRSRGAVPGTERVSDEGQRQDRDGNAELNGENA